MIPSRRNKIDTYNRARNTVIGYHARTLAVRHEVMDSWSIWVARLPRQALRHPHIKAGRQNDSTAGNQVCSKECGHACRTKFGRQAGKQAGRQAGR